MPSLNRVQLMGNLTKDPDLRVTPKGTPVCELRLAVNRNRKDSAGQTHEEVLFIDIQAWGKRGEVLAKHTAKGRPLYVEGRLKLDQWDDKQTKEPRSRIRVILEDFQFIGAPPEAAEAAAAANRSSENLDEDVPF